MYIQGMKEWQKGKPTYFPHTLFPPACSHPLPSPGPNPQHNRTQNSPPEWHKPSPPCACTWSRHSWRTPPPRWGAGPRSRRPRTCPPPPSPHWRPPAAHLGRDLASAGNSRSHPGQFNFLRRPWLISRIVFKSGAASQSRTDLWVANLIIVFLEQNSIYRDSLNLYIIGPYFTLKCSFEAGYALSGALFLRFMVQMILLSDPFDWYSTKIFAKNIDFYKNIG